MDAFFHIECKFMADIAIDSSVYVVDFYTVPDAVIRYDSVAGRNLFQKRAELLVIGWGNRCTAESPKPDPKLVRLPDHLLVRRGKLVLDSTGAGCMFSVCIASGLPVPAPPANHHFCSSFIVGRFDDRHTVKSNQTSSPAPVSKN